MTHTTSNQKLGERIERLVQQHIAESHRSAQEAVERAFAGATKGRGEARPRPRVKSASDKRRTPEEIAALGERFYQAVNYPASSRTGFCGSRWPSTGAIATGARLGDVGPRHDEG